MTTKTIEEIREALERVAVGDAPIYHEYKLLILAIQELAALRTQVQELTAERDRLANEYLAVCEAAGIVYEADGHATKAGPVEAVVEAIVELKRREHERIDRSLALRTQVQEMTAERDDAVDSTRESCARICEANASRFSEDGEDSDLYHAHMADARDIRARKNTPSPREGDKETSLPANIAHVDKDGLRCASTCGLTGDD